MAERAQEPIKHLQYWRLLFAVHLAAAVAAWWLLPGGFGADNTRFWVNQVLPWPAAALFGLATYAALRKREAWLIALVPVIPAFWVPAMISIKVAYPHSGWKWWLLLVVVVLVTVRAIGALRGHALPRRNVALIVLMAVCGAWLPFTQQADPPSTHPWGTALPDLPRDEETPLDDPWLTGVSFVPASEVAQFDCPPLKLWIEPLLDFNRRSLDRGWAPGVRGGTGLRHRTFAKTWKCETGIVARYDGDEPALLQITRSENTLELDAYVKLPSEVYTHLNDYCILGVRGHQRLTLSFSPCPDDRVEPLPSDYPVGRPFRFACLGKDGQFRVLEATSGEKGPFHALASGPMNRGDPLAVTLYDAERALVRLVFEDWSAQCSTELSPTAGWGVPQNEVGFYRMSANPESDVVLMLSLARTSVGRGFDSVGHAPGVYRNRLRIEELSP